MERAFVDTSAWFAFVNAKDPEHVAVRDVMKAFEGRLVTSSFVLDETVTLCRYRLSHAVAVAVGKAIFDPDNVALVRPAPPDERAAFDLFEDRADKSYSLTDCTSFVLMRNLGLDTAIALDDDFSQEGFRVLP